MIFLRDTEKQGQRDKLLYIVTRELTSSFILLLKLIALLILFQSGEYI